ncbi:MAG: hypothetical protein HC804_01745 [Anaerolineae bacterium]|nr:hypothetical protein [Anaerolineae bacterium]
MQTKTDVNPMIISLLQQQPTGLPVVRQAGTVVTIPATGYGRPAPLILEISVTRPLSELIAIGRQYHPLCRGAFLKRVTTGYYHYERRTTWHTCALAAAYAGAYGREAIERLDFSYSMASFRLARVIGYRADELTVTGPTGRVQTVAEEMMQLVDENLWTRQGVAEWLEGIGL